MNIAISSAGGTAGPNILGYLAALLPIEGEIPLIKEYVLGCCLLSTIYVIGNSLELSRGGKGLHEYFYTEQLLPDLAHGALLFAFLVTFLLSMFYACRTFIC